MGRGWTTCLWDALAACNQEMMGIMILGVKIAFLCRRMCWRVYIEDQMSEAGQRDGKTCQGPRIRNRGH